MCPSRPFSCPSCHPQAKLPLIIPGDGSWSIELNWDEQGACAKHQYSAIPLAPLFAGTGIFEYAQKILDLSFEQAQAPASETSEPHTPMGKRDNDAASSAAGPGSETKPPTSNPSAPSSAEAKRRRTAFTPTPRKASSASSGRSAT